MAKYIISSILIFFIGVAFPSVQSLNGVSVTEDLIKVKNPKFNETIKSPYIVKGEARGSWYFEANFPVKLFDGNGNMIAETYATAKGDWMTTEFVPFEARVEFSTPITESGSLLLEKANPSGLSEYADALSVPVKFSEAAVQKEKGALQRFFRGIGNAFVTAGGWVRSAWDSSISWAKGLW